MTRLAFAAVMVMCMLAPLPLDAQALPNINRPRLAYNTRKNRIKPQGDLKAQIDAIDRAIDDAAKFGRIGEVRRLYTRGIVLLEGKAWTPELDLTTSLALRSAQVVVDPDTPYTLRLEQIYAPAIDLSDSLTAHVALHRGWGPPGGATRILFPDPTGAFVRDLGTFQGVGRDLRAEPFVFDIDLQGVPNGRYQVAVALGMGAKNLAVTTLDIDVVSGLEESIRGLQASAAQAPKTVKADILFPVDRLHNVNIGRLELLTFDPQAEFAAAHEVAEAARGGRDPFAGRTGDLKRHYLFESANEILPYRLYLPKSYQPGKTSPLVVALHGNGDTEDKMLSPWDGSSVTLSSVAEQHGFVVVSPLGFRVDGSYGWGTHNAPTDFETRRIQEYSEQDVLEVVRRVRLDYSIDESRIYLLGHSMGANGTWELAAKYPDMWAAIGVIAGQAVTNLGGRDAMPAALARMRSIPAFVVHGSADATAPVDESRAIVQEMKRQGLEVQYVEVPDGTHQSVVAPSFPGILDFFAAHVKGRR